MRVTEAHRVLCFIEGRKLGSKCSVLYLVAHDRQEGYGARAWKGFDGNTTNRLHEKGLISNPVSKAEISSADS